MKMWDKSCHEAFIINVKRVLQPYCGKTMNICWLLPTMLKILHFCENGSGLT